MPNITSLFALSLKKLTFGGTSPSFPLPCRGVVTLIVSLRNYNTMVLEAPGAQQIAIKTENAAEAMLQTYSTLSKSY
jgi:hypothetical protein